MAFTDIVLENTDSKIKKTCPIGACWTVLFFWWFVPMFRKDWSNMLILFFIPIAQFLFFQSAPLIFSAIFSLGINIFYIVQYNKLYVQKLLKQGYYPVDEEGIKVLQSQEIPIPEEKPKSTPTE